MNASDMKVLLVDDDEEEYLLVRRYLGNVHTEPIRVTWAPSFEVALSEIRNAKHDICLLDYQLGAHTGIELLQEIRGLGFDLPVILLTGHGSLELDLAAMELGAFDYIEKRDLNPKLLERSIRYAIADHRARTALRKANEDLERRVQERTAELDRSNRELEQFARVVASDLQEPVRSLIRKLENLGDAMDEQAQGKGTHDMRGALDSILHTARNTELLIHSVLDYAQVGKVEHPLELVDLNAVMQEVREQLENALAESRAEIASGNLPRVRGDRELLQGLLRNLLDNAIKFRSDQPPRIQVSAEQKGGMWMLAVRDNGIGIDPEEAGDIFLMFRRGTAHAAHAGAGMGLAMCRKIVQYHGGRVWVDSEPKKGSTFFFTIPVAE